MNIKKREAIIASLKHELGYTDEEEKANAETDSENLKREKKKAYCKERYNWYKSMGICPNCGQNPAWKGHIFCLECRFKDIEKHRERYRKNTNIIKEKNKESLKKLRQKRIEAGICTVCGKRKPVEGLKYCDQCRKRINARRRELADLKREVPVFLYGDGQHCSVCGKPVLKDSKLCPEHHRIVLQSLTKAHEAKLLKKYGGWDGRGDNV